MPITYSDFHRFYNKQSITDCWHWKGAHNSNGYGLFIVGATRFYTHRYMLIELTAGPIQPHMFALHSCDNPRCLNPYHLRWGTQAENIADMHKRGRANPNNTKLKKLSLEAIKEIRESKLSGPILAKKYSTTRQTIWNIRNAKGYSTHI